MKAFTSHTLGAASKPCWPLARLIKLPWEEMMLTMMAVVMTPAITVMFMLLVDEMHLEYTAFSPNLLVTWVCVCVCVCWGYSCSQSWVLMSAVWRLKHHATRRERKWLSPALITTDHIWAACGFSYRKAVEKAVIVRTGWSAAVEIGINLLLFRPKLTSFWIQCHLCGFSDVVLSAFLHFFAFIRWKARRGGIGKL